MYDPLTYSDLQLAIIAGNGNPFTTDNIIVWGNANGTLVDSGKSANNIPASPAVLLDPLGATQDIVSGLLQVSAGRITLGNIGGGGFPRLFIYSNDGSSSIQLTASSRTDGFTRIIDSNPIAQDTTYLLPNPGVGSTNFVCDQGATTMQPGSKINLDKGTGTEAANAVTIDNQAGVITTSDLSAVTAGSTYVITLTNTMISTSSVVLVSLMGGSNTTLGVQLSATAAGGSSVITIANTNVASNLNGTLLIGFTVF